MNRIQKIGAGALGGVVALAIVGAVVGGNDPVPATATPSPTPTVTVTVPAPAETVTTTEVPKVCLAALDAADLMTQASSKVLGTTGDFFDAYDQGDFDTMASVAVKISDQVDTYTNTVKAYADKRDQCRAAVN